jgi:hypothetical protein
MRNDVLLEPAIDIDPNPDRLTFLPIDPFAAYPGAASRITGLGGEHPAEDPSYAFQSLDLYPAIGPVRFTLHFYQLAATAGTLTVRIQAISAYPGTLPILVKSEAVAMSDIVDQDGIFRIELMSRRNMIYRIGGTIEDETDASALALGLSLDPRQRDAPLPSADPVKMPVVVPGVSRLEKLRQRPELATMQSPVFARPVSQAMTSAQSRDPLVSAWNQVLGLSGGSAIERWQNAFLLQTLHYYDIPTDAGFGLGIGKPHPLPSYLAGRGCTILAAATQPSDLPEGDPGLALEQLCQAELCPPRRFFDAVHLTLFEGLAIPAGLTGFDFLWSTDVPLDLAARARFPQMVRDSLSCLRPGGLAIHLFRYSGEISALPHAAPADATPASYGRAEIERMALSLIADGHEVAQLKFAIDGPDRPGDQQVPFALVARRTR